MALNINNSIGGASNLTNYNTVIDSTGIINQGADFGTNNTNKRLEAVTDFGVGSSNVSISMWIKINTQLTSGATTILAALRTSTTGLLYSVRYYNVAGTNYVRFYRTKLGVVDTYIDYAYTLSTSAFTHIVLTYDGTNITGYINGTSIGTLAASGTGTASTVLFNLGSYTTVQYSSSVIDETAVWTKALISTEVTSLYNSGAGLTYPLSGSLTTSLVSYFTFKTSLTQNSNFLQFFG